MILFIYLFILWTSVNVFYVSLPTRKIFFFIYLLLQASFACSLSNKLNCLVWDKSKLDMCLDYWGWFIRTIGWRMWQCLSMTSEDFFSPKAGKLSDWMESDAKPCWNFFFLEFSFLLSENFFFFSKNLFASFWKLFFALAANFAHTTGVMF